MAHKAQFLTLGLINALLRKTRNVSPKPEFIWRPHKATNIALKNERSETSRFQKKRTNERTNKQTNKKNRCQRNKFEFCSTFIPGVYENVLFGFCQGFLAFSSSNPWIFPRDKHMLMRWLRAWGSLRSAGSRWIQPGN